MCWLSRLALDIVHLRWLSMFQYNPLTSDLWHQSEARATHVKVTQMHECIP